MSTWGKEKANVCQKRTCKKDLEDPGERRKTRPEEPLMESLSENATSKGYRTPREGLSKKG